MIIVMASTRTRFVFLHVFIVDSMCKLYMEELCCFSKLKAQFRTLQVLRHVGIIAKHDPTRVMLDVALDVEYVSDLIILIPVASVAQWLLCFAQIF